MVGCTPTFGLPPNKTPQHHCYCHRLAVLVLGVSIIIACVEAATRTFYQLSDVHLDLDYVAGSDTSLYCHTGTTVSSSGSVAGDDATSAGVFGDYNCDSPLSLVTGALDYYGTLSATTAVPEFIVWNGNTGSHSVTSQQEITDAITYLTQELVSRFPTVTLVPCLGGYDVFPQFQMAENSELFSTLASLWDLPTAAADTFKIGGYYSLTISSALDIIVLNTVYYSPRNALMSSVDDPAGQFQWLDDTLKALHITGKQAILVASVPVGGDEINGTENFTPTFNTRLLAVLSAYPEVLAGHLYGHEHTDSFRVLYGDVSDLPEQVAFIAPSLSPLPNIVGAPPTNPSLRVYTYDNSSVTLMGYSQYYVDLPASNAAGALTWLLEYTPESEYGVSNLTPISMNDFLLNLMYSANTFAQYYVYNAVSSPLQPLCGDTCRYDQICVLRNLNYQNLNLCLVE